MNGGSEGALVHERLQQRLQLAQQHITVAQQRGFVEAAPLQVLNQGVVALSVSPISNVLNVPQQVMNISGIL